LGGNPDCTYPERVARRSAVLTVLLIAAGVVFLDQVTKAWAVANLMGKPAQEVLGQWLQWSYATNSGAAFSFGSGNAWAFTAIAASVIVVILYFTAKVTNRWWAIAMGLILGGGMGNFIDRLIREPGVGQGHVVDFIAVPNWPVFNVADMAVVGGALLAVVLSLRGIDYRDRVEPQADGLAATPTLAP
jgi:signal peptidase II